MELGFETAGNACLIVHDHGPLLVTDPWLEGGAYFESWLLSHEIPEEQIEAISKARFAWISHGHPDHLSSQSLHHVRGKEILLPDHVGMRIADFMRQEGYRVTVLPDRIWTRISPRVRVMCITDPAQDAILLVEIGDKLIANVNDTGNSGWLPFVRRQIRRYPQSFLLLASGFGDIRGMNYFNEEGERLKSFAMGRKDSGLLVGDENARLTDLFGATHFVPFSSMHQYQRTDSQWANDYLTELDDYGKGWSSSRSETLPPYIRYDCLTESYTEIDPKPLETSILPPEAFGDDWSETLSLDEKREVVDYFKAVERLEDAVDFVRVRVGGEEVGIDFKQRDFKTGLTFEVPRGSLMKAIRWQVFEDLLLGNFMKTTLHGVGAMEGLAGVFDFVCKYADNGRVKARDEVAEYLAEYRRRMGHAAYVRFKVEQALVDFAHEHGAQQSGLYRVTRGLYRKVVTPK